MKIKIINLLVICLLSGCTGFVTKEKVTGNYYLVAPDGESQLCLAYCDPADKNGCSDVIESTVFEVGYNKNFIIARQHPNNRKEIINYFILPIQNGGITHMMGLIGPLTLLQFNDKKKELNITDTLTFTIIRRNLE